MELTLPEGSRHKLKKPFGILVTTVKDIEGDLKDRYLIAVGDKVTEALLKENIQPDVCIYDGKTKRQAIEIPAEIKEHKAEEIRVKNPAGKITEEAQAALKKAISSKKRTKILVDGEEDLLALTAIDIAPTGAVVLYGQPDQGMVAVKVDDKTKKKVEKLLGEMIEK